MNNRKYTGKVEPGLKKKTENEIMFELYIKKDKWEKVTLKNNDDPDIVAYRISLKYGLTSAEKSKLSCSIKKKMEKVFHN